MAFTAIVTAGTLLLAPTSSDGWLAGAKVVEDGAIKIAKSTAEYRQFVAIDNPASATTATLPAPGSGYTRDLTASAAAAGRLCMAAVDYSTATTAPELGEGSLWCKSANGALTKLWSSPSLYFMDMSFAPGSATGGAVVVVALDPKNPAAAPTASARSFSIGSDGKFNLGPEASTMVLAANTSGVQLEWGNQAGSPVPLIAVTQGNVVSIYAGGMVLATASASTFVGLSSTGVDFSPNRAAANRAPVSIEISGLPKTGTSPYGVKTAVLSKASAALFGQKWDVAANGAFPNTLKKTTCVVFTVNETLWSQAASDKRCIKVEHRVKLSASKKGRVLSIDTSASAVLVELLPSKKGGKVVVVAKALKAKKGKATLSLKRAGKYRVTAAKSATNEKFSAVLAVK